MKKKLITSLLLATLVLGACQSGSKDASKEEKKAAEGKQINIGQLAADVRSKYEEEEQIDVVDKQSISRDSSIKLDIEFNPKDLGMENYTEIVEVFQNPELTQSVGTHFTMDKETTYIEILPPTSAIAQISNYEVDSADYGNQASADFLFKKESNQDWGNLAQLYMAVKVDVKTGKKLEKPVVTPITIEHEVAGELRLKMTLNDVGIPEFSWNEIAGADYYYVVYMDYDSNKGVPVLATVQAKADKTTWKTEKTAIFSTFKVSQADRQKKETIEKYGEGNIAIPKDTEQVRDFAVIAVSKNGTSAISNRLSVDDVAKRIPYAEEIGLSSEKEGNSTAKEIGLLPSYRWVTMADGTLVQKLIKYEIKKAKEEKAVWGTYEKEDMSDLKSQEVELLTIPYSVEGTTYGGMAKVENYSKDQWQTELKELEKRQDELRNKAGSTQVEIISEEAEEPTERKEDNSKDKKDKKEIKETEETREDKDKKRQSDQTDESDESSDSSEKTEKIESSKRRETEESSVEETQESSKKNDSKGSKRRKKREAEEANASKDSSAETQESTGSSNEEKKKNKRKERKNKTDETVSEVEDKITANNPLSEYLAINMLDGKETIDISDFPEALIQDNLFDAWMEAIYQNPLILSVKGAQIADYGMSLSVTYEIEREEMKEKQAELRTEVKNVVSDIIEEDMSDLEKEYAINAYLIEIAEYDNSALENAEKNDFVNVDPEFNDSFTPYGVLINKVGVCASYAGAFKLLADEAKLEAIVVTGYLEGNLPHAWNKVKIGDNWHILDATNNDNDLLTNALLNIPELASRKVLVEDDRYIANTHIDDYKASDEDKDSEFYHVENKFYNKDKIVDELLSTIEKEGSVALRTNYNLTDEDFATISERVYQETKDEELQGLYWMGVIYLTSSK